MTTALPKTTKQWNVVGAEGIESLKLSEQPIKQLGDNQVLVKSEFHGALHSAKQTPPPQTSS